LALTVACCGGHLEVVRWLVEVAGCDARSTKDKVTTGMFVAGSCTVCSYGIMALCTDIVTAWVYSALVRVPGGSA
jgi:hypothetical protein